KIDLTRQSALINDAVTDIKAIRIKAKKSFVTSKYIELENGKFIISGQGMMQIQRTGGLSNIAQATGKGSSQARLNREYNKKIFDNRMLFSPNALTLMQTQALKASEGKFNFDDNKASISSLQLKVKEIDINRNEGGYDKIDLKFPSLYAGKYKLGGIADNQFSYDEVNKQYQYLGPDTGVNYNLGGAYWGPGWDFQVGRNGSFRFSPIVSLGTAGFQSTNGKDGKDKGFGPGIGGIVHYRDPNTTADLSYSSRAGTAVFFGDRKITENTHLMASYNDFYQNGLLGQLERPNYIAQVTDYRILKQFNNFMLTSFESAGVARDNFFPTFKNSYFVNANTPDPQTAGRLQLQAQIANIRPLLKIGNHVNFGLRGQLIGHAYTTGDFYGIARVGPTLNVNFTKFSSQIGYFQSMVTGQSPFVFDSYFGGAQNLSLNNSFVVNKYLMVGMSQSLNLNRDNARNALAVANQLYFMVGPPDVKMQIGFDFVNKRSQFSVNYYPGSKNTVVNFDKLKMYQPNSFSGKTSNIPANIPVNNLNNMIIPPTSSSTLDSTP
ncbi:MAG: hypothetical protein K2X66_18735, partial [Cyanobacteria bacterium]|nr:hypothetical protein [Cyanobacteriota bacterium]